MHLRLIWFLYLRGYECVAECGAVSGSVLQCVAARCNELQYVAAIILTTQALPLGPFAPQIDRFLHLCGSLRESFDVSCVAVCVVVCCSVLQCV